jgi:hypothetical protein
MSIYTDEGYASRTDYLMSLAKDLGLDAREVFAMADILGRDEADWLWAQAACLNGLCHLWRH